jgi:nucleoside-diphosphate-sugar epimerase
MHSLKKCCAVTGATGYVGSRISEYFATRGWTVFDFARRPSLHPTLGRVGVPFRLDSPVHPAVFQENEIRVMIHCAYDFRPVRKQDIYSINVEGSAKLLRAAKSAGVEKIIFLSSISAFEGCHSLYGRQSWKSKKLRPKLERLLCAPDWFMEIRLQVACSAPCNVLRVLLSSP